MKGFYSCIVLVLLTSAVFSQTITSAQDGPWSQGGTWVGGVVPTNLNSTAIVINTGHVVNYDLGPGPNAGVDQISVLGTLVIDAGSNMPLANGVGSDEMVVSASGVLTVNGTLAFAGIPNRTVIVNGTLNNSGTFSGVTTAKLSFTAGSNYFHQFANAGVIPAATWNANSTVNIVGYTSGNSTPPTGLGQAFGNFVWNSPGQDVQIELNAQPTSITGDFRVESTGGEVLFYSNGGAGNTMNIAGDFDINGGTVGWTSGDAAVSFLNIGGNIDVSGGYVQLADDIGLTISLTGDFILSDVGEVDFSASSAITNLNIQGNYTHTGGNIYVAGGTGNVNFVGASVKVFTSEIHPLGNVNYSVASLSTLDVPGNNFIGGAGNFTLNGTLRVGSEDINGALQTGDLAGNLRTGVPGVRTFATNAFIVYNGTGPQFIGNGFPSGGDVNLTINNPTDVTLSSSLDIVALRTLNLASGNIVIGTQTLTINGTVTGAGGIVGGPSSNLVIGGTGNFGTLTFNGTNTLQNFTLNRTGSGLVTLGDDLTILGTFTHTNGTLAVAANTFTVTGDYGPASPADVEVTLFSSFVVDGAGTLPSDISFAGTELGTLTLNRAGATLPTTSTITIANLNLLSGIFNNGAGIAMAAGGVITRTGGGSGGSMTTNPSNTTDAYDVVYASGAMTTGPELPSSTTALANLSKTGTGALTLGSNITVNGILTLSNGTFNAGSNAIDLKGGFVSSAASTLTSSPVTFSGTTIISGSAPPTFGLVTITGVVTPNVNYRIDGNLTNSGTLNAGTGSVTFGGSTLISGGNNSFNGLTIASASTLTGPPSGSISVAGNFANGGTFTHNSGTVVFNGTSTVTGTAPNFNTVTITGTFNAPANLNVAGNLLVNNGTFTHNSGTVTFNGTLAQNLNRNSGAGDVTYNLFNVTVNKPSGVFAVESTIAGTTFTVANQFTIGQNGTGGTDVDFDGSSGTGTLVLLSTSTRTAQIPTIPAGANLLGNLTVERFIPNNDGIRAYRYFAPPVVGSTVADWQNEISITGAFSNPSGGGNSPSMYQYIETNGGVFSARYQAYPNNAALPASSFPLDNGRGYAVYGYSTGTPTINTRGTLRIGNFGVALTITGTEVDAAGFNLIGNPYPAPIDWDLVSLPGGVSSTISLKDNVDNAGAGTGNYVYYVQGGPNVGGFTGVIASTQAFWVETSANTTLTFTEAQKVTDINPVFVREQSLADVLRINILGNGKRDESVIWLQEEATDAADLRFDAKKKINDHINLYTFLESAPSIKYAINGVRNFGCSKSFKLGLTDINSDSVNVVTPGTYTLGFSQFETFTRDYSFTLLDKFEHSLIDIRLHPEYTFEVTTDAKTFGEDRFEILITQPDIQTDNVVHYDAVCENAEARVTIENSDPTVSYEVKDHQGQLISNTVQGNGNSVVLILPKEKLVAGTNNFLVFAQNGLCEAVPLQQTVTLSVNEIYSIESVDNGTSCKSGALTLKAYGVPSDGEYHWYDTETSTESLGTGSEWTTPVLDKSKTYYVAAKNALGCEGGRMEVKAEVVQFEDAAISVLDNGVLSSNYSENIQWYFNDTIIPDATNQEIIPDQSGVYKIEASLSGGCATSAQYEFSVTGIEEGLNKSLQVYPNPVIDRVNIELKKITPADAVILNSVGKAIGSVQFSVDGKHQKGEFNMGSEAAGLYLIKIIQGKKVIHYKIIKK